MIVLYSFKIIKFDSKFQNFDSFKTNYVVFAQIKFCFDYSNPNINHILMKELLFATKSF